jgi:hypothetical protein
LARVRVAALCAVVLLLAAACSGADDGQRDDAPSATGVDESKPPLRPDGPLRGLVMATGIAQDRSLIDPRLGFATDDKAATAIVGIGLDVSDGATLTVAWYRLRGVDGREHLFSHKIVVGPGGLAHSEGVAGKGLAPGLYETVATMRNRQVRAPWVVRVAAEPQRYGAGSAEFTSFVGQAPSPQEDWEVPGPGESGWDGDLPPPPDASPPDTCTIVGFDPGLVPLTDVTASAFALGPCSELTLDATVAGPPVRIGSMEPAHAFSWVYGQVDVCSLPGGSDLPGTVVRFEVSGSASDTLDYTLPDLSDLLIAGIEAEPVAGSHVEAGDRIGLHALAMMFSPSLGIEVLYVDDGSDLIGSVGNLSGTDGPVSCDYGRNIANLLDEYVVPDDPPAVIGICAHAKSFPGAMASDCIEFYTGEVWKGTYTGTLTYDCNVLGVRSGTVEGELTITVGTDGTATMDVIQTLTGISCGPDAGPVTSPRFTLATGRKTPTGFEFPSIAGSGSLTIPVSGDRGTGTFAAQGPDPYWGRTTLEVNLTFEVRRA